MCQLFEAGKSQARKIRRKHSSNLRELWEPEQGKNRCENEVSMLGA